MKSIIFLISMLLLVTSAFSQRGRGQGNGNGNGSRGSGRGHQQVNKQKRVVVKNNRHNHNHGRVVHRSPYRPAKIVVYHPHWRPNYGYHRRWVYFPRHNFYWDNWRQGYYYMNGPAWVFNVSPPPIVVNVNLAEEKNYELKEEQDDVDDVYKTPNSTELKTDTVK